MDDRKISDVIDTLHWSPDNRLSEGVLCFRANFPYHLVYSSVGRVALFSVDSSRCWTWPCWGGGRSRGNLHAIEGYLRLLCLSHLDLTRDHLIQICRYLIHDTLDLLTTWAVLRSCTLSFSMLLRPIAGSCLLRVLVIPGQTIQGYHLCRYLAEVLDRGGPKYFHSEEKSACVVRSEFGFC